MSGGRYPLVISVLLIICGLMWFFFVSGGAEKHALRSSEDHASRTAAPSPARQDTREGETAGDTHPAPEPEPGPGGDVQIPNVMEREIISKNRDISFAEKDKSRLEGELAEIRSSYNEAQLNLSRMEAESKGSRKDLKRIAQKKEELHTLSLHFEQTEKMIERKISDINEARYRISELESLMKQGSGSERSDGSDR